MKTAIDSNIISALFGLEPSSRALVLLLGRLRKEGALVVCGPVYAEIHAIPGMSSALLKEFLEDTEIIVEQEVSLEDWNVVAKAFADDANRRRKTGDGMAKRLLVDFMVGAHAARHCQRLLTLDPKRYKQTFPKLKILGLAN